jgi:hypothetical protein
MCGWRLSAAGLAVLMLAVAPVCSDEETDLRTTIARAIQAKGSRDSDSKYKALTMKGTGTFHGLGEAIPFSGEWHFQGNKQSRFTLEIKVMNQALSFTQIVNNDKGWVKFNDEIKDMSQEELAEEKQAMYAKWVANLVPLKDKAFKLASLGEVKVDEKGALGVRVSYAGQRDVNLFFDKASGLLVKVEHQVKDVKGGGDKEMSEETFFADFKEFKKIKYPTKVTIKRDDKPYVEAEMTDIQPLESVDDALFAKP